MRNDEGIHGRRELAEERKDDDDEEEEEEDRERGRELTMATGGETQRWRWSFFFTDCLLALLSLLDRFLPQCFCEEDKNALYLLLICE